ncbi:MAG: DNA helicase RecQ [Synechococcus sp. SB0668_bin_15]|nr:DNA helicase RecQ [Synechococcus sp. SB0668_bin_15]MYC50309.1 DNA helicase RecQ [Synechococcus sp. SB0662_bin_14]
MTSRPQAVLREVFGHQAFRPGQAEVIEAILDNRHVLAVMPTGAGKSLCFQVPALVRGGLTVVVSPLVALMQDQVAALRLCGVAADSINSGRSRAENVATWRRVVAGEIRLLYMAPERLMTEPMLAALAKLPLTLLVVDEAHCISQWGHGFRPEYADLCRLHDLFPHLPILALTATADAVTRDDIAQQLLKGRMEHVVQGFDRPNIHLSVQMKRNWKQQLLEILARHQNESGIVYCLSRNKTDSVAALLQQEGFHALPYHAAMDQAAREANQNTFITDQAVVMVATIAFGMGIDKADVRFVVHTDLPGTMEAYYQEIGRAGRDGAAAEAYMLYGLGDLRIRRQFIEDEPSSPERKRREHKRLDALLGYCESPSCRRIPLLAYFGEVSEPCGNCDICRNPVSCVDGTEMARQVLAVVQQSGQRYGAAHVVDILYGAATEKVRRAGHEGLKSFGVGKERRKNQWRSLIRQMVATGLLKLDIAGYGSLMITPKGHGLQAGEGTFLYREDTVAPPRSPEAEASASARKTRPRQADEPLNDQQGDLLAALKALRLHLARQRGVPPYIIFPDRTLIDMVRHCPRTVEEFAQVNGVGAVKLKDFAEPFLAEIAVKAPPLSTSPP